MQEAEQEAEAAEQKAEHEHQLVQEQEEVVQEQQELRLLEYCSLQIYWDLFQQPRLVYVDLHR